MKKIFVKPAAQLVKMDAPLMANNSVNTTGLDGVKGSLGATTSTGTLGVTEGQAKAAGTSVPKLNF